MRVTGHSVVIAGGGPTGLMLAGELALARVDLAIVERRANQDLAGSRAGGLHSRTIEVLDQRGIAERFLSQGQVIQVAGFAMIPLDISDFPTRHGFTLLHYARAALLNLGEPRPRHRSVGGSGSTDRRSIRGCVGAPGARRGRCSHGCVDSARRIRRVGRRRHRPWPS
jgi:FAD binding domain